MWASKPELDNASDGFYAFGLSAAIPAIPAAWSYSVLLTASYGGVTAGTYAHGAALQSYYSTTRLPSVTLSHIGYYTDDGACKWRSYVLSCGSPIAVACRLLRLDALAT